jgi:hypothetical protein
VLLIQCKKTTNGGDGGFKDDIHKIISFQSGGNIEKWMYVLRTKTKIVDMYLISNQGVQLKMHMDWKSITTVVNAYRKERKNGKTAD